MSGSGPGYIVPDATGHIPVAKPGSYRRVSDGATAELTDLGDYPLTAECDACGGQLRLDHPRQPNWGHVHAGVLPVRGGAAC